MNKLVEIIKYAIIIIILVQTHFGAVFEGQILNSNHSSISHKSCKKQTNKQTNKQNVGAQLKHVHMYRHRKSSANTWTKQTTQHALGLVWHCTKLRLNRFAHCSSVQCGKVGTKENYFYCSRFRSSQHPTSGSLKVHNSRNFPILGSHESHQ